MLAYLNEVRRIFSQAALACHRAKQIKQQRVMNKWTLKQISQFLMAGSPEIVNQLVGDV